MPEVEISATTLSFISTVPDRLSGSITGITSAHYTPPPPYSIEKQGVYGRDYTLLERVYPYGWSYELRLLDMAQHLGDHELCKLRFEIDQKTGTAEMIITFDRKDLPKRCKETLLAKFPVSKDLKTVRAKELTSRWIVDQGDKEPKYKAFTVILCSTVAAGELE